MSLCYELWKHRNNVYWNDKPSTVAALVYAAKMELEQWTESQTSLLDILHNGSCCDTPAEKWKNPTAGWMKINVDAAIFPNKHSIGTGCVTRDHVNTFMAAKLSRSVGVDDVVLAEALGIKYRN